MAALLVLEHLQADAIALRSFEQIFAKVARFHVELY